MDTIIASLFCILIVLLFTKMWSDEGRPLLGYSRDELYMTDTCCCWNAAYELYLENQESIDSLHGIGGKDGWNFKQETPNEYDLLLLIDVVLSYGVLD